jgi:hypothetical protein
LGLYIITHVGSTIWVEFSGVRASSLNPGKQSHIPALGEKMGPTPGLATREPTGQTETQARQEVQPASAKGIPEKVLTTVSMPLKAKSSMPEPCW